jgi:hypothetical protein
MVFHINALYDEDMQDACDITGLTQNYGFGSEKIEHAIISFDEDLEDIQLELTGVNFGDWVLCQLQVTDPVELKKHRAWKDINDPFLWWEVIHLFKILPGTLQVSDSIKNKK